MHHIVCLLLLSSKKDVYPVRLSRLPLDHYGILKTHTHETGTVRFALPTTLHHSPEQTQLSKKAALSAHHGRTQRPYDMKASCQHDLRLLDVMPHACAAEASVILDSASCAVFINLPRVPSTRYHSYPERALLLRMIPPKTVQLIGQRASQLMDFRTTALDEHAKAMALHAHLGREAYFCQKRPAAAYTGCVRNTRSSRAQERSACRLRLISG